MSVYETYTLEQLVGICLEVKEADDFMSHSHKGAFAKAVSGDENRAVDPRNLTEEEAERARKYFISECLKFNPCLS
ncbi:MAG TPA: hypothetical protein VFS88_03115 [Micavibrio sp.]|nr:hypothetical protein [Micavibrio sp.]